MMQQLAGTFTLHKFLKVPTSLYTLNTKAKLTISKRFISSPCLSTPTSQLYPPSISEPKVPIFLRPPTFSTPLTELQKFHKWANSLALSVGSTFEQTDNGPDSTLLCRELKWLLQDSFEDPSQIHQLGHQNTCQNVNLRLHVEELYTLWKQRIEARRPFQYVVGCEHWRDLVLCVQEGVLIPRPETEKIVEMVESVCEDGEEGGLKEGVWADLGTGSGAIAIGIARVLGSCGRVVATDLSVVAVAAARFNVQRYGLQEKIEVRQGSWFEPLEDVRGKLAGLVSNPPYIPSDDIPGLQAEVGKHEPRLALDGGVDGMNDLVHLCKGAASMLRPGGFLAFETNGKKQCEFLSTYMANEFKDIFCSINIVSDFAGIQRFVTAVHR